jgi:hypothetical protein
MKHKFLVFLLLFISHHSFGDQYLEFTKLDCFPSISFFKFESELIYVNHLGTAEERNKDLLNNNYDQFESSSCTLPMGKFDFKITKQGKINPDSYLDLILNGKVLLSRLLINKSGFETSGSKFYFKELRGELLEPDAYISVIDLTFTRGQSGVPITIRFDPRKGAISKSELKEKLKVAFEIKLKDLPYYLK